MTTTNYINSNGLGLKVIQLPSGAFEIVMMGLLKTNGKKC